MAKSQILKELANDEIQINVALQRLMLLASDLGDDELLSWADKELSGYSANDDLPEYRKIRVGNILISGIKGNAYNSIKYNRMSVPLHLYIDDKKLLNNICTLNIFEPISNIIQKAASPLDTSFSRSLMELNELIWHREQISCSAIEQPIQPSQYADVLAQLKQITLKIFIKLDKEYGNLDDLDIVTTNKPQDQINKTKAEVQQIIYNVTITQADLSGARIKGHKIKDSNIGSGTNTTTKTTTLSPTLELNANDLIGK